MSWAQLKKFLKQDRTDRILYSKNYYMCGEFAEDLHNNAENNGIRTAWVAIRFVDSSTLHALNAFVTTNRGLVFINTTGTELGFYRPQHLDRIVKVKVGDQLRPDLLFASDPWEIDAYGPRVSRIETYW